MAVSMTIAPFDRSLGNAGPPDVSPGRVVRTPSPRAPDTRDAAFQQTQWHSFLFGSQPQRKGGDFHRVAATPI